MQEEKIHDGSGTADACGDALPPDTATAFCDTIAKTKTGTEMIRALYPAENA